MKLTPRMRPFAKPREQWWNSKTDQDVGFTWMVSNSSWGGESGNVWASWRSGGGWDSGNWSWAFSRKGLKPTWRVSHPNAMAPTTTIPDLTALFIFLPFLQLIPLCVLCMPPSSLSLGDYTNRDCVLGRPLRNTVECFFLSLFSNPMRGHMLKNKNLWKILVQIGWKIFSYEHIIALQ